MVLEVVAEFIDKMEIENPICYCKTHPEHNCGITSNEALSDLKSAILKELK
jgi:hypothetical protein